MTTRFRSLILIPILALSGCGQAPHATTTRTDEKPGDSAASDTPSEPADHPATFTETKGHLIPSGEVPLLEQIDRENEKVVSAVSPAVVRITAMTLVDPHSKLFGGFPFKLPGLPHGVHPEASYGSGVIISKDGYVVTNDHVIAAAQSIEVELSDQRKFDAHLVATDQDSDVAVLKIAATDLPALPWGNSDKVQVGQQVFAVGNPFDLAGSVSRGIVSAKDRSLPDSTIYEDYIQTDAAINVGNSGGALVNIHGELIGINAAIASFTQGSEGVGFSIPSNLVRHVVEELVRDGRMVRGYLGVQLPVKIDDGVADLLGFGTDRGALLAGVLSKSPAESANLHPVDLITSVDGHRIEGISQLRLIVAQIPVGKQVQVNYIRAGGATRSTTLKIAELPKDAVRPDAPNFTDPGLDQTNPLDNLTTANHVLTGLQVTDLNDKSRQRYGIDSIFTTGVVVTGVQENTPADIKGIVRGDVIEIACAQRGAIHPLANPGDFADFTKNLKADQSVVLLVHHGRMSGRSNRVSVFAYLAPLPKQ